MICMLLKQAPTTHTTWESCGNHDVNEYDEEGLEEHGWNTYVQ